MNQVDLHFFLFEKQEYKIKRKQITLDLYQLYHTQNQICLHDESDLKKKDSQKLKNLHFKGKAR